LGPWQPTSSLGREVAVVFRPPRFWRATRQGVMRPPQETGGYHSAVLRTTVPELEPTAVADAYDGRARIAATFCQDTQALGLGKRRQHTWEAPPLVLLFARLAPPLLLGSKPWLSRGPRTRWRLQGYGLVRWLQEVYTVATRRAGQCPLRPFASPGNPTPARLGRAFRGTCTRMLLALKTGSCSNRAGLVAVYIKGCCIFQNPWLGVS